jgi:membrane protein implicated in regulation of membrane protease activity
MKLGSRPALAVLAFALVLTTACASTNINRILSDPSRYRNQEVTVKGTVTESMSIIDRGVYRLEDKSGQIWIVSGQGVPRTGAKVSVTGKIRDVYDIGSLGGRLDLPQTMKSGLVMVESSHRAR